MTARSSPATEPLRADARRNRQRLLDVAHEAFMETGVTASMDDIARRAGVGSGTLYRHFPTRDALILALVADDLERLAALADELRSRDPSNGLESWLAELVEHNRTYRGLAESIIASTGKPTPLGAACDRLHNAGAALVRDAQAARHGPNGHHSTRRHRSGRGRRLDHPARPRRPTLQAVAAGRDGRAARTANLTRTSSELPRDELVPAGGRCRSWR